MALVEDRMLPLLSEAQELGADKLERTNVPTALKERCVQRFELLAKPTAIDTSRKLLMTKGTQYTMKAMGPVRKGNGRTIGHRDNGQCGPRLPDQFRQP